ncbi:MULTISPECIES: PilN domain-containing protein [unclassified Bradyrhizobium]|uniref:PilN domain-containing protein n=1 Tax=unclassified Bradyrhizobium TaxID=2631580 RepID=UPI0028EA659F|nr:MULTISPECIES: PilN domain-containing protein [unclassified Bradyrhizobium]
MQESKDKGALLATVRAASPRDWAQSAFAWWCREAVDLLPQRFVAALAPAGRPRLLVDRDDMEVRLRLHDPRSGVQAGETTHAGKVTTAIASMLQRHGLDRRDVDLGLRLPADSVFGRDLVLPREAKGAIDTIVPQDLLRRTPFKAEDIYCDHVTATSPDGRIAVRQWVTRRHHVKLAADQLGLAVAQIDFVVFGDDQASPSIRLTRPVAARKTSTVVIAVLGTLAVLLGSGIAALTFARQQATLDRLDAEIVVARKGAERVRVLVDQLREQRTTLSRLRLQRSEVPGLIDVWDEASRILPKHSWLTELRIVEGPNLRSASVTMTGFSAAAPSLINTLAGSKLFADAALTSPVAMDPIESRERFSLQARIRVPDAFKEVAP